jgi:hypothetical protein
MFMVNGGDVGVEGVGWSDELLSWGIVEVGREGGGGFGCGRAEGAVWGGKEGGMDGAGNGAWKY